MCASCTERTARRLTALGSGLRLVGQRTHGSARRCFWWLEAGPVSLGWAGMGWCGFVCVCVSRAGADACDRSGGQASQRVIGSVAAPPKSCAGPASGCKTMQDAARRLQDAARRMNQGSTPPSRSRRRYAPLACIGRRDRRSQTLAHTLPPSRPPSPSPPVCARVDPSTRVGCTRPMAHTSLSDRGWPVCSPVFVIAPPARLSFPIFTMLGLRAWPISAGLLVASAFITSRALTTYIISRLTFTDDLTPRLPRTITSPFPHSFNTVTSSHSLRHICPQPSHPLSRLRLTTNAISLTPGNSPCASIFLLIRYSSLFPGTFSKDPLLDNRTIKAIFFPGVLLFVVLEAFSGPLRTNSQSTQSTACCRHHLHPQPSMDSAPQKNV